MYAITFLQGLVFYGPVATLYRQSRGLSMYNIFLIESIFMILMLLFEVPWGWFADKYGYKITLLIANLLLFISKIIFYEANSFYLFLAEGILVALATSAISGCDIALLYASTDKGKTEKVFGTYTAMGIAGFLLACLISTRMVEKSMDLPVFETIIPYGAAVILTFFIKDVCYNSERKPSVKESIREVLNNRQTIIIVVVFALISETTHSIGVFLNQPQYLKSGIDIRYFGFLTALMQIVCLLSAKSYKFTERFGKNRTTKVLLLSILMGCIVLVYTGNPIVSVGAIAITQGCFSIIKPIILDIENKSINTTNRATVLSIYAMAGDILSSVVNIFIGKFADISIEVAFKACTFISVVAFALALIYFKIDFTSETKI